MCLAICYPHSCQKRQIQTDLVLSSQTCKPFFILYMNIDNNSATITSPLKNLKISMLHFLHKTKSALLQVIQKNCTTAVFTGDIFLAPSNAIYCGTTKKLDKGYSRRVISFSFNISIDLINYTYLWFFSSVSPPSLFSLFLNLIS
jgi:hypothetical protein